MSQKNTERSIFPFTAIIGQEEIFEFKFYI